MILSKTYHGFIKCLSSASTFVMLKIEKMVIEFLIGIFNMNLFERLLLLLKTNEIIIVIFERSLGYQMVPSTIKPMSLKSVPATDFQKVKKWGL
ncbi:hypothetical protein Ctha_0681 [Chloroherpeton thalassium ATCC 35110]|uniref:Uncharacterized protein n=1 Tax=Chloroherpeton thalassium (strain ATCC 35110 / GB-78) TaxID=517418 RepID=B3QVU3_CHLT3|nr:hypothetical protein Ctha_0681 [Chloroherpeton thalassium ATCC 35110]